MNRAARFVHLVTLAACAGGGQIAVDEAPDWSDITNVPADLADGDDDTTYTAGEGLSLSGTELSVDASAVEGWATAVCYDTEEELYEALDDRYLSSAWVPGWSDIVGVPSDLADGDDDTTYTAGEGLALSGTELSVDRTSVEAWATEAVAAEDAYVRQPEAGLPLRPTRSYVERLCDGQTLQYKDPVGNTDSIDLTGMTDGQFRSGVNGRMHFLWNGEYGSVLYLDISPAPGWACTLLHDDDDRPLRGWYYATNTNHQIPELYQGNRAMFMLMREDIGEALLLPCQGFSIVCF